MTGTLNLVRFNALGPKTKDQTGALGFEKFWAYSRIGPSHNQAGLVNFDRFGSA